MLRSSLNGLVHFRHALCHDVLVHEINKDGAMKLRLVADIIHKNQYVCLCITCDEGIKTKNIQIVYFKLS